MKLELLASASPDCPLIRMYEFNSKEARELHRITLQLAKGEGATVLLHKQPNVTAMGNLELALQQGPKDRGVSETSPLKFEWALSQEGWLQVADLIRPFSQSEASGFQWLWTGKVNILLSCDGKW